MKKFILISLASILAYTLSAQALVDIYKAGSVKLVADQTYAQNNDWEKVFETYYDTIYDTPMGNRKSIKLLPDGSVVVNHEYRNFYSKFSPNGSFVKEFGITNSTGKRFKKTKPIEGVINNTFFTELDNMGNMTCFDFDGNFKKTLKLNYMCKEMIALPNGKIAVVGWSIWSKKFRDFVAIVDYETNEQKIIWENFIPRTDESKVYGPKERKPFRYIYRQKSGGMVSFTTMPTFTTRNRISAPPQISSVGNELILSFPKNGKILRYTLDGKLTSEDQLGVKAQFVTIEEQKEMHKKAISKYKGLQNSEFNQWLNSHVDQEHQDRIVKEMESDLNKITKPLPIPIFSTIIKDSDGNLLYFEYPKEDYKNTFNVWVFRDGGKLVCKSSFKCEDYNLEINPSKMVFKDGYIYALQKKKNVKGNPLRLVRFNLQAE